MKLASITFQISKKTPEIVRETGCKFARSVKVGVSVTRKNLVTLVGVNHWESVDVAPMKLLRSLLHKISSILEAINPETGRAFKSRDRPKLTVQKFESPIQCDQIGRFLIEK